MPDWVGSIDKTGSPFINIALVGPQSSQKFRALVDTGFSGFALLPLQAAIEVGLEPKTEIPIRFADGSRHLKSSIQAHISVADEIKEGTVLLEPSSKEAIIGMEFLREFGRVLFVHPNRGVVRLFEQEAVDSMLTARIADNP